MASAYSTVSQQTYTQLVLDQNAEWYTPQTMRNLINALRTADFKQVAGRTQAMQALTSLLPVQPYSVNDSGINTLDLRFGTRVNAGVASSAIVFIAAFCDGWDVALTNIRNALDTTTRQMNNTTVDNSNGSEVDQSKSTPDPRQAIGATNDATLTYNRGLSKLCDLMRTGVGAFNYHLFEAKYSLNWSTTMEPRYPGGPLPHTGQPGSLAPPQVTGLPYLPPVDFVVQTPQFAAHLVSMVKGNPQLLNNPVFTEHFLRAVAVLSLADKTADTSEPDTKGSSTS